MELVIVSIGRSGGTRLWIPVGKKSELVKKKKERKKTEQGKEEIHRSQSAQRKKHMSQQSRPSVKTATLSRVKAGPSPRG